MVTRRSIAIRLDCYSPPPPVIEPERTTGRVCVTVRLPVRHLSAFQDGISVHGYKYVPRVSPPQRGGAGGGGEASYIDERTTCIPWKVDGWNEVIISLGGVFEGCENTKVGAMMGVTNGDDRGEKCEKLHGSETAMSNVCVSLEQWILFFFPPLNFPFWIIYFSRIHRMIANIR